MIEKHYTSAELAELLALNAETVRRHAAAGRLRSVRIGHERRYPESAVREWLEGTAAGSGGRVVSIDRRREKMPAPDRRRSA